MDAFQGPYHFTTQLRDNQNRSQDPGLALGPARHHSRLLTSSHLSGWRRARGGGGERTEIDIATTVVSGKTGRRTGLNGSSFFTVVQQGGNGVKVYYWNDAFLSPANATCFAWFLS